MLIQSLKELEKDGLVNRKVYRQVPPKVEYSLTDLGKSFIPVLDAMFRWGQSYASYLVAREGMDGGFQVGDILDVHQYPNPRFPRLDEKQAVVCGEFGGLGWPIDGHLWWTDRKNWGYRTYHSQSELRKHYRDVVEQLIPMIPRGLAAAVCKLPRRAARHP